MTTPWKLSKLSPHAKRVDPGGHGPPLAEGTLKGVYRIRLGVHVNLGEEVMEEG